MHSRPALGRRADDAGDRDIETRAVPGAFVPHLPDRGEERVVTAFWYFIVTLAVIAAIERAK